MSPVFGGGVLGAVVGCVRLSNLKRARRRGRSSGLVVHFVGAVMVAVARPISPCCVSCSTRAASLASSGGRLCGVSGSRSSVSSVSHAPLQKRCRRCVSVSVCEASFS